MDPRPFALDTIPPHLARSAVLDFELASGSTLCGLSSAAVWQLPLPVALHAALRSARPTTTMGSVSTRDRSDDALGRRTRLPARHRTMHAGLCVTTPARTWLDCSGSLSFEFCVAMGDHILHHRLAEHFDLEEVVRWGRGRRGVKQARMALPILSERAESPRESWLRASLSRHDVPAPEVNVDVIHDGALIARVDLAWPIFRVALEYDGVEFHGPDRADHDERRRSRLLDAGWIVLVVRNEHLAAPHLIAMSVNSALRSRGWAPSLPV